MANIFISHSSRNSDRAIEVRSWLAANGWDDVFLGGMATVHKIIVSNDPDDELSSTRNIVNALKLSRCSFRS